MSITTDSMNAVSSGGINYDFYGLSKTLNNYSADEIWDYVFCSASSNNLYHIGYGSSSMSYYTYQDNDNYVPFELRYVATNHNNFYYHPEQLMNNPDGLYMRVIWLQRTSSGSDNYITNSNGSNYKLITEWNAPHYVYECNTPRLVDNTHGSTSWNAGSYLYYCDGGDLYYYDDVTLESPLRINIPRVVPAIIFKDKNNKVYILPYRQNMSVFTSVQNTQSGGWNPATAYNFYDFTGANCIAFPVVINAAYQYCNDTTGELTSPYSDGSRLPEGSGIYPRAMFATTTINHLIAFFGCGGSNLTLGFQVNNYFRDVENCKKFFALAGLHFKADKIYKPVIEGGYVTGFTDVLDTPSDLDNWDGKTKHTVPPSPPSPTPSGDDPWHGIDFGGNSGGGGAFAKFYYMTSTELANLRSWMNSNSVPEGFNPMAQIIGLSQVPVAISGSAPENVMFVNSSAVYGEGQDRVVDSGVATQRGLGNTIIYNLGSVEIPRRMQQRGEPYLDYSCAVELYLPFCGIFSLDTQAVMGRTITAQLVLDPTSGSVTGYAWVENGGEKLPVAYGSGQVGVDLPISAQQYSMNRAALNQANANFGQSMLQSAVGLAVALGTSGTTAAESAGDAAYLRSVMGGRGGTYGAVAAAEKGALAGEVGTYVKS